MKKCCKCNQFKEMFLFSINRSKRDGLEVYCKSCYSLIRKIKDQRFNEKQKLKRKLNKKIKYIQITRIHKKTLIETQYTNESDIKNDGFNICLVKKACKNNISYKGYLWFFSEKFTNQYLSIKLIKINTPKRKRKVLLSNKFCYMCSNTKSLNEFYKDKSTTSGYRSECKICLNFKRKIYFQKNPLSRLAKNLRKRLNSALKVKNWQKNTKFNDYIGCSKKQLEEYIQSQFSSEMNWNNYGEFWEIDHKIPLVIAKTDQKLYELSHYSNLRPLTVTENRSRKKGEVYQTPII